MININIAIPSYGRSNTLAKKTLATLQRYNVPKDVIHIFVIDEEYDAYFSVFKEDYKIIKGQRGIIAQRQFIRDYFEEGDKIIFMDDDIDDFDFGGKSFDEFATEAYDTCKDNNAFIFGLYPVWNSFYRQKQKYMTTDLRFIIGAFYGIINRHGIEYTLQNGMLKSDVENTLMHWIKDGIVIRFNQYGIKTKMYSKGGLGGFKDRLILNEQSTDHLVANYGEYGKRKIRKNGCHEFILNNRVKPIIASPTVKQWKVDPSVFSRLEELFKTFTVPYKSAAGVDSKGRTTNGRRGFPKHRGCVFGLCKQKIGGKIDMSYYTKRKPDIYEELVHVGKLICPFDFTSIQVNNNLVCPSHKDTNNVGDSILVSFGQYEGCNIVIDGNEYDAKYSPIIFNGSELEHYNTPLIAGNKYSLVFFSIK